MKTYATLCSGVEGCTLALNAAPPTAGNWRPVFFSEIAKFPSALLDHYYPEVPNLGDIKGIYYDPETKTVGTADRRVPLHERLDLLAGGTPCQDFSVAGRRAGGAEGSGTRSSLCWEYLRLVRELNPRVLLWENVPGTLSSNRGADFAKFVAALNECGYCVGWRILDCQYTRVDKWPMAIPQRRRRLWLVGLSGSNVGSLGKILFERKSVLGSSAPRRDPWEETARSVAGGPGGTVAIGGCNPWERVADFNYCGAFREGAFGQFVAGDVAGTLKRVSGGIGGGSETLVCEDGRPVASEDVRSFCGDGQVYPTIDATIKKCPNNQNTDRGGLLLCSKTLQKKDALRQGVDIYNGTMTGNVAATITARTGVPSDSGPNVLETLKRPQLYENHAQDSRIKGPLETASTISRKAGTGGGNVDIVCEAPTPSVYRRVRRLMPEECELLMGYPLGYTRIPYRGKPADKCPDGPRYEACGNGWAINCARWVLLGIDQYLEGMKDEPGNAD